MHKFGTCEHKSLEKNINQNNLFAVYFWMFLKMFNNHFKALKICLDGKDTFRPDWPNSSSCNFFHLLFQKKFVTIFFINYYNISLSDKYFLITILLNCPIWPDCPDIQNFLILNLLKKNCVIILFTNTVVIAELRPPPSLSQDIP